MRKAGRRHRADRVLIDGARELERALDAGVALESVFVRDDDTLVAQWKPLLKRIEQQGTPIYDVAPTLFRQIRYGQRDAPLLAVAQRPERHLERWQPPDRPLLAILDNVEKPGNLGALVRTADAAGIDAVFVTGGRVDPFNPNAIRASVGTVFHLPIFEVTTADAIDWVDRHRTRVYVTRVDAREDYTCADYCGGTAFVFGSEAYGVSEAWQEPRWTPIRLPMRGLADSLNVSVTAAVLFYEARRQRDVSDRTMNS